MKIKYLIFTCSLLFHFSILLSQRVLGVGYDFNDYFYKESPEFKDLTLKENFQLRSNLKIREIVKKSFSEWPSVFSKQDSIRYKIAHSSDALKAHGPIIEHYKYNSAGILINYYQLPLYYKADKKDSLLFNTITISIDSVKNGYIVNYINSYGCGHKEVYVNNLFIEERQIGCCYETIGTIGSDKKHQNEYVEYTTYKYTKEGKIFEKEYNDKAIDDVLYEKHPEYEKYTYQKDEINIVKIPFHCSDCTKGNYYNKIKLNEYGKIKESRFWMQADKSFGLTYSCDYDDHKNLTNIYYEFDNDHKKGILDTYTYNYSQSGYKVTFKVDFYPNNPKRTIEFDALDRITTIKTKDEEGESIQTFEYK